MKKVLFLAIAALTYVGAANAQVTLSAAGATLPSPTTPIIDVVEGTPYQLTLNGKYDFVATRTDWTTLGTYTAFMNGSKVDVTKDALTTMVDAGTITSAVGTGGTATFTVTGAATVADLKIEEFTYDTYGAKSSCSASITASFASKPEPTLQVTDDKSTQCVGAAAPVTVKLVSITAGTAKRWIKLSLVYTDGAGTTSVISSKYFDFTSATTLSIPASLITVAGKYTLTAEQVWDEYSLEASNASSLGLLTAATSVDHFTALPLPTPTLKTNAIQ